jgi:hypothetical protein
VADSAGGNKSSSEADLRLSLHPVDVLIRDLIRTPRPVSSDEVARIIERMATAPFNQRLISVPSKFRGLTYQGRMLGNHEDVWFLHLVQRVVAENQWADGTDAQTYLDDLRNAILHPTARLCVYRRRGGNLAATLTLNPVPIHHRGAGALRFVFVVYSADRGRIVSGYQVSGLETISISEDGQWLK